MSALVFCWSQNQWWFKKNKKKGRGINLHHSLLRNVHYGKWLLVVFWIAALVSTFTGWWRLRLNLIGWVLVPVGL